MANIRRKFERWFKHCDESNLKVERRAIAQCPPERLQTAAKSMFRQEHGNSLTGAIGETVTTRPDRPREPSGTRKPAHCRNFRHLVAFDAFVRWVEA